MKMYLKEQFANVYKFINNKYRVPELSCAPIMDVFQYFDGIHNNYYSIENKMLPSSLEKIVGSIALTIKDSQV